MRAASVVAGEVVFTEVPVPTISGPNQVLVRNLVSTICGSDVHILDHGHPDEEGAQLGFPGHESVGVVQSSSDPQIAAGDLILAVPDLAHAGGFADYQLLPSAFTLPLPAGVAAETFVLAQQLGTAIFAMKRFWPAHAGEPSGTAVVLGAGPVGLFFTRLCRLAGFDSVLTTDLHEHRLEAARRMGATRTVCALDGGAAETVAAATGDGAQLVVEAAGTDRTRVQAIDCVALDGRIGMFGMPTGPEMTLPFEQLFRRRPTVEFCWGAQAEPGHDSFRQAIRAIHDGRVDTGPLQLRLRPLDELAETLRLARAGTPDVIKTGIRFP